MGSGGSRPGAGRKRASPALKMTAAERAVVAVPAGAAAMMPPMYLSELAQRMFGEIAGLLVIEGRAEQRFAQHVALLAMRLEQIQRFQSVLEMTGDTCTSKSVKIVGGEPIVTEMIRARPEVAMLSDAMRQTQSLLGELMLNPSAALRIATGKAPAAGDFDDF